MSTKFYEEECLPRVKAIARELDFLCENSVDKDELEEQIEELESEWQDALYYVLEDTDEDINPYSLKGEALLAEMDKRRIDPEESIIEDYIDLCEQLKTIERIGASNLYEYFDDYLDVEYTINSNGDYLGACIWIGLGGPNIWIDTRDREIKLAWGNERASWGIASDTANEIDEIFEGQYQALR